ncbi:MAG TPA: acyltransferase family protein [Acidimicrobiia bacterium]|nr:acyltransferase family protein [Acidimicrobiia bacterium]
MAAGEGAAGIARVSALDGARGLAVAGVVLFHGGHLVGGYLGVDFFFTLSGFLITSLLLAESAHTGRVRMRAFWARRARRLLPALAVLIVGVAVYAVVWAKPTELAQIRGDALATLGYVANWHDVFAHTSYFALFNAPSPLDHTWSLAIEEQFYILWPLVFVGLLLRFRRNAPKAVLVTALALAAISSVLMVALYHRTNSNRVYYGTDTRAAAILLGVALAATLSVYGPVATRRARIALEVAGVAAAIFLAIAWATLHGESSNLYRGGFLACGLAATVVIAAAVHPERGPLARVLSFGPLCALGLISYGVYLYHWPVDVILSSRRAHVGGWPLFLLQTAVTLAIAIASYWLVEQPIRHGAFSARQLRALVPVVAVALVAAVVTTTSGAEATPKIVVWTPQQWTYFATVAHRAAPVDAQRVMVVGDSVADFLGREMGHVTPTSPVAVFNEGLSGCVYPSGVGYEQFDLSGGGDHTRPAGVCNASWQSSVVDAFRPNLAFLVLASPATRVTYGGRWIRPCSEPYDSLFERDVISEIRTLGKDGSRVAVTTTAYAANEFAGTDRGTDCNNRLLARAARATGASLIDLFHYVCPDGTCRTKLHGVTLRPDGLHYSGPGGQLIARWLLDQAKPPRAERSAVWTPPGPATRIG